MAYVYFANNLKSKSVGDCVIRALSKILDTDWERIYIDLSALGLEEADMPSSNAVWGKYLRNHGFRRYIIPNSCPECYTINQFCYDNPYGDYVVCTGSHTVAVINGDYFDAWPSGSETLVFYYHKEAY